MDLKEERNMILDMVAEGKITVEEAKQLLDALEKSASEAELDDDFFATPKIDFNIPEVRIPNIPRIFNRAYRQAVPRAYSHVEHLEDMRENLEDEIEQLREELEALKGKARHMRGVHWNEDKPAKPDIEEDWED